MDLGLAGKIVLITGGSKGIGFACARLFQGEGARVAIVSRDQRNLDAAAARLDPGTLGVAADLVDPDAAALAVERVEAQLGPIEVLVNSAGAAKRTPPDDLNPAAWRAAMDAKYFSYIHVIDPLIKRMAARRSGVIVNIIGAGGKIASPTHIAGGAANAALMLATAGLASAYASRGVRVIGVNPGLTRTDRVAEGLKAEAKMQSISEAEALKFAEERIPMGRMAEPEEIANTVLFLASAKASYATASIINMDGAATASVV